MNAALSCASAAPLVGYGASTVKFGKWGDKGLDFFKGLFGKGKKSSCKVPNSFTPETRVQLAGGSTKAISLVAVGDRVLATDPESGRTEARPVTKVIEGAGQKDLVELTVDTDGAAGNATGTLKATANHPFWVQDLHSWVDAEDITLGAALRKPSGATVEVIEVREWTAPQKVFNLSVDEIPTYYALAGDSPVLVHNCGDLDKDLVSGGHAKNHVGLSDDALKTRAKTLKGGEASSLDPATAQASINKVLEGVDLNKWAANQNLPVGKDRLLTGSFAQPIGRVADAQGNVYDATKLTLVIRKIKDPKHKGAWIVYTVKASR
ncbi:polymorphic toxin-type HINT domain-containing protein [Streptomyces turgidiscabies]|uniref:Bacterial CdiA-CT RNAse A domain-containing protein n=1 Tax=Streptomyces turgidiscabies TaxID=85558 RepID=A0ABU0RRL5_9ACTN|nr:polymorphic toxin-type HINT domain-containing protein [Streptomyces turgidiscabies]MDQ0934625.1 hypothetical protein [Streptomyces turgidiscabies]